MSAVDLLCDAHQACALDSLNRGRCRPWLCPGSGAGEPDAPAPCGARVSPLRVPPAESGDPAGAANPVPPRAPRSWAEPRPRCPGRQRIPSGRARRSKGCARSRTGR